VPQKLSALTAVQYKERVEMAADFLDGRCKEMFGELEEEMHKAAAALEFEKAAELRNMLEDLRRDDGASEEVHALLSLPGTVRPEDDMSGLQEALGLHAPPRHMERFDISKHSLHAHRGVDGLLSRRRSRPPELSEDSGLQRPRARMTLQAWRRSFGGAMRGSCARARRACARVRLRAFAREIRWIRPWITRKPRSCRKDAARRGRSGAPAWFSHRRRRKRAAVIGVCGIAETGVERSSQ
jgi:hypothetical protein